ATSTGRRRSGGSTASAAAAGSLPAATPATTASWRPGCRKIPRPPGTSRPDEPPPARRRAHPTRRAPPPLHLHLRRPPRRGRRGRLHRRRPLRGGGPHLHPQLQVPPPPRPAL